MEDKKRNWESGGKYLGHVLLIYYLREARKEMENKTLFHFFWEKKRSKKFRMCLFCLYDCKSKVGLQKKKKNSLRYFTKTVHTRIGCKDVRRKKTLTLYMHTKIHLTVAPTAIYISNRKNWAQYCKNGEIKYIKKKMENNKQGVKGLKILRDFFSFFCVNHNDAKTGMGKPKNFGSFGCSLVKLNVFLACKKKLNKMGYRESLHNKLIKFYNTKIYVRFSEHMLFFFSTRTQKYCPLINSAIPRLKKMK